MNSLMLDERLLGFEGFATPLVVANKLVCFIHWEENRGLMNFFFLERGVII